MDGSKFMAMKEMPVVNYTFGASNDLSQNIVTFGGFNDYILKDIYIYRQQKNAWTKSETEF